MSNYTINIEIKNLGKFDYAYKLPSYHGNDFLIGLMQCANVTFDCVSLGVTTLGRSIQVSGTAFPLTKCNLRKPWVTGARKRKKDFNMTRVPKVPGLLRSSNQCSETT